uniref:GAG-pre-integrase domain-containing protein n=1 Tax=Chenopodium quinoa TaxID=63459 RepID=A0A803MQ80_CHEQI
MKNGLYYLVNDFFAQECDMIKIVKDDSNPKAFAVPSKDENLSFAVWHHRLGHASLKKLQHIECVRKTISDKSQVCVTCPLAKFTKLPYQSDNALEFDDGPSQKFFAAMGIVHQTSCVDRPQQNARVERKHRHVLEIARAIRFQAGLELSYWVDAMNLELTQCEKNGTWEVTSLPAAPRALQS